METIARILSSTLRRAPPGYCCRSNKSGTAIAREIVLPARLCVGQQLQVGPVLPRRGESETSLGLSFHPKLGCGKASSIVKGLSLAKVEAVDVWVKPWGVGK